MTGRSKGLTLGILLALLPTFAAAEPAPRVKLSRDRQQATITLKAGRLAVTQTLTRQSFALTVAENSDTVRITGNLAGDVTVERGPQRQAFSMRTAAASELSAVAALLAGSSALRSFEAVMRSEWAGRATVAGPFRAAQSMVALFRGDHEPVIALMSSVATPAPAFIPVRDSGPRACWLTYARDVVQYTYDLESCLQEAANSWWLGHAAWCAYEYDLKATLALFWLADCSGLPI